MKSAHKRTEPIRQNKNRSFFSKGDRQQSSQNHKSFFSPSILQQSTKPKREDSQFDVREAAAEEAEILKSPITSLNKVSAAVSENNNNDDPNNNSRLSLQKRAEVPSIQREAADYLKSKQKNLGAEQWWSFRFRTDKDLAEAKAGVPNTESMLWIIKQIFGPHLHYGQENSFGWVWLSNRKAYKKGEVFAGRFKASLIIATYGRLGQTEMVEAYNKALQSQELLSDTEFEYFNRAFGYDRSFIRKGGISLHSIEAYQRDLNAFLKNPEKHLKKKGLYDEFLRTKDEQRDLDFEFLKEEVWNLPEKGWTSQQRKLVLKYFKQKALAKTFAMLAASKRIAYTQLNRYKDNKEALDEVVSIIHGSRPKVYKAFSLRAKGWYKFLNSENFGGSSRHKENIKTYRYEGRSPLFTAFLVDNFRRPDEFRIRRGLFRMGLGKNEKIRGRADRCIERKLRRI